jgi:hypothetical protein
MSTESGERLCEQCGHPFDPHGVFALGETAAAGGVVLCNVPGCDCCATWSLGPFPPPTMPDPDTLERLRAHAQKPGEWD